ncbi:MAG: DUF5132 domain-containing protein [Nitrospira sp. LK70]|nr:DUF5132 domain-containing protein [Nitrospira sp. LK70]
MERIISGIGAIFRPIAKELIKGGIVLADAVSEYASEAGEQFKDLLAEAKDELEKSKGQPQGNGTPENQNSENKPNI